MVTAGPISQLLFFHKAIKCELDELCSSAISVQRQGGRNAQGLLERYEFIRMVYKYHSIAEDDVRIFYTRKVPPN